MPESEHQDCLPEQERLHRLLIKIVAYQRSLPDGRGVEVDELKAKGVLKPVEIELLTSPSVTYKPHRLSNYHALDMFRLPRPDGGYTFIGPSGPPLVKRRAPLWVLRPVVESFFRLPRPKDELLLHIEFTQHDGMAVAPEMICWTLHSAHWKERLPAIRSVAGEFELRLIQDQEVQVNWLLSYIIVRDPARTSEITIALLNRGCGISYEAEVTYSAGALDEADA